MFEGLSRVLLTLARVLPAPVHLSGALSVPSIRRSKAGRRLFYQFSLFGSERPCPKWMVASPNDAMRCALALASSPLP